MFLFEPLLHCYWLNCIRWPRKARSKSMNELVNFSRETSLQFCAILAEKGTRLKKNHTKLCKTITLCWTFLLFTHNYKADILKEINHRLQLETWLALEFCAKIREYCYYIKLIWLSHICSKTYLQEWNPLKISCWLGGVAASKLIKT